MPFTRMLRRYRAAVAEGERGMALATVIGISALLLLLVVSGLTMTESTLVRSAHDRQWSQALAAAYAGVADYQARITADQGYANDCNPASTFTSTTGGQGCVGSEGVDASNPAFDVTAGGLSTWASVGSNNEYFRYEVDDSQFAKTGVVRLRVTGLSGDETRTIIATVRQRGFLDYLLYTDSEQEDPQATGAPATCTLYYPGHADGSCWSWSYIDQTMTMNGPVGSNDALSICNGTFTGPVTTGELAESTTSGTGCNPDFESGSPIQGDVLAPPRSVSSLETDASCIYTGPTSITFDKGRMVVYSPLTKTASAACGTPMAVPVSVAIPNGLIYVQNVPASALPLSPSDAAKCATANGAPYGNALGYPLSSAKASSSLLSLELNLGALNVSLGLVPSSSSLTESATALNGVPYYGCTSGDAFVSGTVDAKVTVAAENDIWITDDITYANATDDVLGLVAQNSVEVWNPMMVQTTSGGLGNLVCNVAALLAPSTCARPVPKGSWFDNRPWLSSNTTLTPQYTRTIDAAIMSLGRSFTVQNYCTADTKSAASHTLTIYGSITEKYHGPQCSTADTSQTPQWTVSYNYDSRLRTMVPPFFPTPADAAYIGTQISGTTAAFNADGSPVAP